MTPWNEVTDSPIHEAVKADWHELLDDTSKSEPDYLAFLRSHAGFFSPIMHNFETVLISELRLGADYRIDFVLGGSVRSYGFKYTLIEIESPHTAPFTKKGVPSARLTTAMQQTRDWRNWIASHREEVRRLFPAWTDLQLDYQIVIGRRSDPHMKKRNQISSQEPFHIRSFDYLTDFFEAMRFSAFTEPSSGPTPLSLELDNEFTNPFYMAYSDRQWRCIVDDSDLKNYHMVTENIRSLLANREYNTERPEKFRCYLATLPLERQTASGPVWRTG